MFDESGGRGLKQKKAGGLWTATAKQLYSFFDRYGSAPVDMAGIAWTDAGARAAKVKPRRARRLSKLRYVAINRAKEAAAVVESRRESWSLPVDMSMLAAPVLVVSYLLPGAALEFGGTRASFAPWVSTLGGEIWTSVIAMSLGLVFVLLGHVSGHVSEVALHAKGATRVLVIAVALAGIVTAWVAIDVLGKDRAANLTAASSLAEAGTLKTQATTLKREADGIDRRAAASNGSLVAPETREGKRLRDRARELEQEAIEMRKAALRQRQLKAFTRIQQASLVLAFIGGFLWSASIAARVDRRSSKAKGKYFKSRLELLRHYNALVNTGDGGVLKAGAAVPRERRDFIDEEFDRLFGDVPKFDDEEEKA